MGWLFSKPEIKVSSSKGSSHSVSAVLDKSEIKNKVK